MRSKSAWLWSTNIKSKDGIEFGTNTHNNKLLEAKQYYDNFVGVMSKDIKVVWEMRAAFMSFVS